MFHSLFVTNTSVLFGQVEHLQVVLAVARAALALPQPAEGQEVEEESQQHQEALPHLRSENRLVPTRRRFPVSDSISGVSQKVPALHLGLNDTLHALSVQLVDLGEVVGEEPHHREDGGHPETCHQRAFVPRQAVFHLQHILRDDLLPHEDGGRPHLHVQHIQRLRVQVGPDRSARADDHLIYARRAVKESGLCEEASVKKHGDTLPAPLLRSPPSLRREDLADTRIDRKRYVYIHCVPIEFVRHGVLVHVNGETA